MCYHGGMKTLLLATLTLSAAVAWCAKPAVIPEIQQWIDLPEAGSYTLDEDARVVIPEDACADLERYAKTFAEEIDRPLVREASSWLWFLGKEAKPGDIVLMVVPDAGANQESYRLTAGTAGVRVAAPTPLGAFWGTRTLLQVFQAQGNTFPGGVANDWPEFSHRGFMFDCGRKPFALSTLRQLAKICAYYKMNELHLHLSDNYIWLHRYGEWFPQQVKTAADILKVEPSAGGFRLENSKYPELTSKDIFYTKAQFKALVAEAAAQGVTIVPELDVPGHALQMVRVRPDLMYKGSVGGKHDMERAAMLDLSNPETLPFVASIFDEYIDEGVFPGQVVHTGTDEYYGDNESYRKFVDAFCKHIRAKGKTPRLWGSFSHKRGKTPVESTGVQMNIWSMGWQNPVEATKAGYEIMNTLDVWMYIVPSGNGSVGGYGDDLNTQWVYNNWNPVTFPKTKVEDLDRAKVLGGSWAMWNDNAFLTDPGLCAEDLMPRIQKNCATVAQKTWVKANGRPYKDFLAQVQSQAKALDAEEPQPWELSFDVTVPEGNGKPILLASSEETDLYAVSPVNGNVGFRREGAQYTFDVKLPEGKPTKVTFHSEKYKTWVVVDGKKIEGNPVREHYAKTCKFFTLAKPETK